MTSNYEYIMDEFVGTPGSYKVKGLISKLDRAEEEIVNLKIEITSLISKSDTKEQECEKYKDLLHQSRAALDIVLKCLFSKHFEYLAVYKMINEINKELNHE